MADGSIVHIAGAPVQVGAQLRQRCSWCGAVLADYALDRIAVPEGQDPMPSMWPVGGLVEVDGPAAWVIPYVDGAALPANACGQLDHDVTGAEAPPVDGDPGNRDAAARHALDRLDAALYETNAHDFSGISDDVLDEVDRWANNVQSHVGRVRRSRAARKKDDRG